MKTVKPKITLDVPRFRTLGLFLTMATLVQAQNEPPRSILTEDIPPIPDAVRRAVAPYRRAGSFQLGGWLGSRREVLMLAGAEPAGQVFCVVSPNAPPHQLTEIRGRLGGVVDRPGHNEFVLLFDAQGEEHYQMALHETPTQRTRLLRELGTRTASPVWSSDGALLAYASDRRTGNDFDVYVYDVDDPRAAPRQLADFSGLTTVEDWSPDGRWLAVINMNNVEGTRGLLIDVQTGEKRVVLPTDSDPSGIGPAQLRFTADRQSLLFTAYLEPEFRQLGRLDLKDGRIEELSPRQPRDVEDYTLADDGRTVVALTNVDGYSSLDVLDLKSNKWSRVQGLPRGQISGLAFQPGSTEVAFNLETHTTPSEIASIRLPEGILVYWTHHADAMPRFPISPEPEQIEYKSFDGREIPAFVYRPRSNPKWPLPRPVLIDVHGGPQAQFRPVFLGKDNFWMEHLGMALIFPNIRGSAGYGRSFLALDDGLNRHNAVRDLGALLDWIETQPDLDPNRVVIRGGSYGGFMTLAALAEYSDRLRAGIDIAGISSLSTFLQSQDPLRREFQVAEFGDPADARMRAYQQEISPLTRAQAIRSPLLVAQGRNDTRVPEREARQIVNAVRGQGVDVWYMLATNEGHIFTISENVDYLFEAQAFFVIEQLRRRREPRPPAVENDRRDTAPRATSHDPRSRD